MQSDEMGNACCSEGGPGQGQGREERGQGGGALLGEVCPPVL